MTDAAHYSIAVLPGDGIGPEVVQAAKLVLEAVGRQHGVSFSFDEHPIGGAGLDVAGDPFPPETAEACKSADAVLLGAVGGPKWDAVERARRPEAGLLRMRSTLQVFANLRPVADGDIDLLIVRELTGGIYFGRPSDRRVIDGVETARDTMVYSREEIQRVARIAFDWASRRSGHVTSVDKANVLSTSRLWRETVTQLRDAEYPQVRLDHEYVDIAAMNLVKRPRDYDVVLTGNLFGDILSDLAAVLPGSIGVLPSASLGDGAGLFEPVHGSAPDIAGLGFANPIGTIQSAAMMLDFLSQPKAAEAVRSAVDREMRSGQPPADMVEAGEPFRTTLELTSDIIKSTESQIEASS